MTTDKRTGAALLLPAIVMVCLLTMLGACGEAKFKVSGEVENADNVALSLEKADFNGRWVSIDSVRTDANGNFSVSAPAPSSPDIYRLALDDRYIYFPVDSVETISIKTDLNNFGRKFTMTGTPQAEQAAAFEAELLAANHSDTEAMAKFKKEVYGKYLHDSKGGILSYYILTKTIDGKPLYDPTDPTDARYFAAVATSFDQFRPNDPHTDVLKTISVEALKRRNSSSDRKKVMEAEEIHLIDIDLTDENGKKVALSQTVGGGKPTVVVFSVMTHPDSPDFNRQLSEIYNSGRANIYHVSYDSDIVGWRDAARNLPWITVLDDAGSNSQTLVKYNVGTLPAFFIYNNAGELIDRAFDIKDLKSKLR